MAEAIHAARQRYATRSHVMTAPTTPTAAATFASAFAPATEAQWRALVDKALKGADFDRKLVARTADGIAVKPLYTRSDALTDTPPAPGLAPYTRGRHGAVPGLGWDITSVIDNADAPTANRAILADLEGGANAILVTIAAPGQSGVRVDTVGDWSTLMTGVYLDLATIELDGGLAALEASQSLLAALPALAGTAGTRRFQLNLDPIGSFARHGTVGQPVPAAIEASVALAKTFRAAEPLSRTLLASGLPYHEAGGSEAQELAGMAAALIAYLRAFETIGVAPAEAVPHIAVHLATDADIFLTAAKIRAARTIIARIAAACGAADAAASVRLTAVSSRRMMARRDPWTNMLRTTVATAAASFGGADSIVTRPFTDALGEADAFARRIARNTQIVAQEESGLGHVIDPVGGSWYVEKLTADLANEAWNLLQEIEADGGIVAALRSGLIQGRIASVAAERAKGIATGRIELTGVSTFPKLGDDGVAVAPRAPAPALTAAPEIEPLTPIRLAARFEALRDAADASRAASTTMDVLLVTLGPQAQFTARATWVTNLLASGGIGVVAGDQIDSKDAAETAFAKSGACVAVIASSDAEYAKLAEPVARALKTAGATHIALAGRPGDAEANYRAAGIDRFIFAGQDAVATLTELQGAMG